MTRIQLIRRGLLAVAIAIAGLVAVIAQQKTSSPNSAGTPPAAATENTGPGGEFTLTGTDNKPFDSSTLKGRLRLVYFGYTFCPDACPTDLLRAGQVLDALGPDAEKVAYQFITVDPARDTPAHLAEFLKDFDSRIIGLTGDEAAIKKVMAQYRVYAQKSDKGDPRYYLVDHTVLLYLLDGDAHFVQVFRPAETADDLVKAIRRKLAEKG